MSTHSSSLWEGDCPVLRALVSLSINYATLLLVFNHLHSNPGHHEAVTLEAYMNVLLLDFRGHLESRND